MIAYHSPIARLRARLNSRRFVNGFCLGFWALTFVGAAVVQLVW